MFLYKLCWIEEDTDVFDSIEILTEADLCNRLREEIDDGLVSEETLEIYNMDNTTRPEEMDVSDVMGVFDELGYAIAQIEINE